MVIVTVDSMVMWLFSRQQRQVDPNDAPLSLQSDHWF
jgi:hypothetical protein